jgi:hypothetical protein
VRALDWLVVGISVTFLGVNLSVSERTGPVLREAVATDADPVFAYVHDDLGPLVTASPVGSNVAAEVLGGFTSEPGAGHGRLAFGYIKAADADRVASIISASPASR